MRCHRCDSDVDTREKIGRQDLCVSCGAALHCCLNCRFYDANAYHQCRESEAEWVSDKAAANFCDYFRPGKADKPGGSDKSDEARKKLEELFGSKDKEEG